MCRIRLRWPSPIPRGPSAWKRQANAGDGSLRALRGPNGFGYDPLFLIREYHQTFGQLSPLVKSQLSHRARAFARLRPQLDRLIATGELDAGQ